MNLRVIFAIVLLAIGGLLSACPRAGSETVNPGSFCNQEGEHGKTDKGTEMICTRTPGEDRARWRAP